MRETLSDFTEQSNEGKMLGYKREISRSIHFTRKVTHLERQHLQKEKDTTRRQRSRRVHLKDMGKP